MNNSVEKQNEKKQKLETFLLNLIDGQKSVIISSFDEGCVSSYAPFLRRGDEIYAILSSVAPHYHAIKKNKDLVSILFIVDEQKAHTIFARVRASFKVEVSFADEKREEIFKELREKYEDDAVIDIIEELADFHILKFKLKKGRFVRGFGAAYETDGLKIVSPSKPENLHGTPNL